MNGNADAFRRMQGTRGVIWQQEIIEEMQYYQDRTFFHTFPGDVRLFLNSRTVR